MVQQYLVVNPIPQTSQSIQLNNAASNSTNQRQQVFTVISGKVSGPNPTLNITNCTNSNLKLIPIITSNQLKNCQVQVSSNQVQNLSLNSENGQSQNPSQSKSEIQEASCNSPNVESNIKLNVANSQLGTSSNKTTPKVNKSSNVINLILQKPVSINNEKLEKSSVSFGSTAKQSNVQISQFCLVQPGNKTLKSIKNPLQSAQKPFHVFSKTSSDRPVTSKSQSSVIVKSVNICENIKPLRHFGSSLSTSTLNSSAVKNSGPSLYNSDKDLTLCGQLQLSDEDDSFEIRDNTTVPNYIDAIDIKEEPISRKEQSNSVNDVILVKDEIISEPSDDESVLDVAEEDEKLIEIKEELNCYDHELKDPLEAEDDGGHNIPEHDLKDPLLVEDPIIPGDNVPGNQVDNEVIEIEDDIEIEDPNENEVKNIGAVNTKSNSSIVNVFKPRVQAISVIPSTSKGNTHANANFMSNGVTSASSMVHSVSNYKRKDTVNFKSRPKILQSKTQTNQHLQFQYVKVADNPPLYQKVMNNPQNNVKSQSATPAPVTSSGFHGRPVQLVNKRGQPVKTHGTNTTYQYVKVHDQPPLYKKVKCIQDLQYQYVKISDDPPLYKRVICKCISPQANYKQIDPKLQELLKK